MRTPFLVAALFVAACNSTVPDPDIPQDQASRSAETQYALDQILREINAGKVPVGVLEAPPLSVDDALAGLLAMGLEGTTDDPPSVVEHEGYLLCSWNSLEMPSWGQRGYAIKQLTGEVYAWSLW